MSGQGCSERWSERAWRGFEIGFNFNQKKKNDYSNNEHNDDSVWVILFLTPMQS